MVKLLMIGAVAELADAGDLKSSGGDTPCGFDSHRPHRKTIALRSSLIRALLVFDAGLINSWNTNIYCVNIWDKNSLVRSC
jgi:hypothetical protein